MAPLHEALDAAYGTLVTVAKRRHLLIWEGVRIHLDDVDGLGTYVELEAVAEPDSDLTAEHEKVERLRAELGIEDEHLVATSYADLLLETTGGPRARRCPARASWERTPRTTSRRRSCSAPQTR